MTIEAGDAHGVKNPSLYVVTDTDECLNPIAFDAFHIAVSQFAILSARLRVPGLNKTNVVSVVGVFPASMSSKRLSLARYAFMAFVNPSPRHTIAYSPNFREYETASLNA